MKYFHCLWIHTDAKDPVIIVSEFDDNGFEKRKVEIWRSGRIGWAGENGSSDDTRLGTYPLISINQYNDDKQFLAIEITKDEFENHWVLATSKRF